MGIFKRYPTYKTPKASNMIRAVLRGQFKTVGMFLKSGLSPNISNGDADTILVIAIEKENLYLVKLLLAHRSININIPNEDGQTALFIAIQKRNIKIVKYLVWKGADVNFSNSKGRTPLLAAIPDPKIAHFLIRNGADIDKPGERGNTPLHRAVILDEMESLCMLLYYNADANIEDEDGIVPYERAFRLCRARYETVLAEYTMSSNLRHVGFKALLILALRYKMFIGLNLFSHYVEAYVEDFDNFIQNIQSRNGKIFKILWDNLRCYQFDLIAIDRFLWKFPRSVVEKYLNIIIESPNNNALRYISFDGTYQSAVEVLYNTRVNNDIVTKLVYRMLENGWNLSVVDLYEFFYCYWNTELFKLLPYITYEGSLKELPKNDPIGCVLRFIFDVGTSIQDIKKSLPPIHKRSVRDLKLYLRFCADRHLMFECNLSYSEAVLPAVPTLVELARDAGREHIINSFGIKTTCQYHTTVNHLDIPEVCKKILKFEKNLYDIPLSMGRKKTCRICFHKGKLILDNIGNLL